MKKNLNLLEYLITSNAYGLRKIFPIEQILAVSQCDSISFVINIFNYVCVCDFEHHGIVFLKLELSQGGIWEQIRYDFRYWDFKKTKKKCEQ